MKNERFEIKKIEAGKSLTLPIEHFELIDHAPVDGKRDRGIAVIFAQADAQMIAYALNAAMVAGFNFTEK